MEKKTSAAQRAAVKKYDEKTAFDVKLKFNKKTDADIINKLEQQHNKQGYIKQLIRNDIKRDAAGAAPETCSSDSSSAPAAGPE